MADVALTDQSGMLLARIFSGHDHVEPGTAERRGDTLVWSVSPGEWTVAGHRPGGAFVDLTHVRAAFRLTGCEASDLMSRVCSLDLGDGMFPNRAAARTLFAGVATEIVRDDSSEKPSYLILPSRSYGHYIHDVIGDAATEFGGIDD